MRKVFVVLLVLFMVFTVYAQLPGDMNVFEPFEDEPILSPAAEAKLTKLESLMMSLNGKMQPVFEQSLKNTEAVNEMRQQIQDMKNTTDVLNGNQVQIWGYLTSVPRNTFLLFALYFNVLFGLVLLFITFSLSRKFIARKAEGVELWMSKRKIKDLQMNLEKKIELIGKLNSENHDLANQAEKLVKAQEVK